MDDLTVDERDRTMRTLRTLDRVVETGNDVRKNNGAALSFGRMAPWGITASMRKGKALNNYAHKANKRAAREFDELARGPVDECYAHLMERFKCLYKSAHDSVMAQAAE